MLLRCWNVYLWVLFGCCFFPGIGWTREVHDSFEEIVLVPKKEDNSPEAITKEICGKQITTYETYKASFRRGKNLPEILAVLLELKSECEVFAKHLLKQDVLSSPVNCYPSYPLSFIELRSLSAYQEQCFAPSKDLQIQQLIDSHLENVSDLRQENVSFMRAMLSLRLCVDQQTQKELKAHQAAWNYSIRKWPMLYSRGSSPYLSLLDTIHRTRKDLLLTKRAIKDSEITPISCFHPEMKRILRCPLTGEPIQPEDKFCGDTSLSFLRQIAERE